MRLLSIVTVLAAAASVVAGHRAPLIEHRQDDVSATASASQQQLENEYIVVLKDEASLLEHMSTQLMSAVASAGDAEHNQVLHVYESINAYGARMNSAVLDAVRSDERVAYVEQNQIMYASRPSTRSQSGNGEATQWEPVSWGLERVSHRDLPLTGRYDYHARAGDGVTVYVIDTGVQINHVEFNGRASWGLTAPRGERDEDGNGHGTHVAGTIAGDEHGIAKQAKIVAVKVLKSNGSGSMLDVIKGIDWVGQQHQAAAGKKKSTKSVANMSLGGGKSPALNRAVENTIKRGVHFAVAAGNEDSDACNVSPASATGVISVGASTVDDRRAYFSNWGQCVTIFAPGHEITSSWIGSKDAVKKISGTSMASPHVAGVMALLLGEKDLSLDEMKKQLATLATDDRLTDVKNSPNLLLHNGVDSRKAGDQQQHRQQPVSTKEKIVALIEQQMRVYF